LRDVPATTIFLNQLTGRIAPQGFHPAPRRQLVVVLRGAFEITTTQGQRARFGPGDCLFADDLESKGHTFEDVGDEPLVSLTVGLLPDWHWPVTG
jgi:hypothetical protein